MTKSIRSLAVAAAVALAVPAVARELAPIKVTSSAFTDGGAIPREYTCEGTGNAPPLSWSALPPGTRSVAVVVEDPDAPGGTFDHLALWNLPPTQSSLPTAAVQAADKPGSSIHSARNSSGATGFAPICPPSGRHHYRFVVTALDAPLMLTPFSTTTAVKQAIDEHAIGRGVLVGVYQPSGR